MQNGNTNLVETNQTASLDTLKYVNGVPTFDVLDNVTTSERIQREIIAAFVPTIHQILVDQPIILANLEKNPDFAAYRQHFLQSLRENRIASAQEDAYLKTLPSALDEVDARTIYDQITHSQRQKQILAIVTGHNSTNWQDVVAADITKYLAPPRRNQPDYRTPVGFADVRRRFLIDIKEQATPAELDLYIKAMDEFETKLYRTRYEYYREFEALRREANSLSESVATIADETMPVADGIAAPAPNLAPNRDSLEISQSISPSMRSSRLAPVSDEHRDQLVSHAIIEGDPWRQGGQDYNLTVSSLVSAGLVPKYEISADGQTIYLTNLFQLTNEQMAALAYIPAGGGTKVRAYYRDKNQALWRYLPDYIRDISGEGIASFGTGFDEKSTILPIALQSALNQIERSRGILDLSSTNPDFLFAGTAPAYASRQEFRDIYSKGMLRGDFYREVSSTAYNMNALGLIGPGRRKNAPQLLSVNNNQAPNFQHPIAHYSVYSALTGQTMGEGFPAENGQTSWLLYSDYRGRCWVANIETNAPITSTGCRKEWLLPTDISTPLYESTLLADNYGDPNDVRTGNYICMWNNYLSKVPLLVEYNKFVTTRGNESMPSAEPTPNAAPAAPLPPAANTVMPQN